MVAFAIPVLWRCVNNLVVPHPINGNQNFEETPNPQHKKGLKQRNIRVILSLRRVTLYEHKSVIIFDEIQLFPKARQAIKHLVKDGRYHYIETGSLIFIRKNVKDILIPSEEMKIAVYPMDYEEFCDAVGNNYSQLWMICEMHSSVGQAVNRKLMWDLRLYLAVGHVPLDSAQVLPADVLAELSVLKVSYSGGSHRIMEKITSFTVNHLALLPGIYVSRRDAVGDTVVTTFDLRLTRPNYEPVLNTAEVHTIEHLGATYLRNEPDWKEKVLYFGPMGCRTGFYLLLKGDYRSEDIVGLVTDTFRFIADYHGDVPGAAARDCGNYLDMNLPMARYVADRYVKEVLTGITAERLVYPE